MEEARRCGRSAAAGGSHVKDRPIDQSLDRSGIARSSELPKRRSLLLFDSPLQGAPSPAPILSPRILHNLRSSAPPARARWVRAPPAVPPRPLAARSRRRAARRPASARRVEAQLLVNVLGPRCSSRPSLSSLVRPRRATRAARSRRARASCAAPRRAAAATRERERARHVENSLGERTHVRCCLLAFYLQGAHTAQLQHGALDAAARRRSNRIRRPRRCGRDRRFRFSPVRTHALLLHLSSRGRLLELASAAPPLSFAASASLRSSSARNFARSGRPKTSSSGRSPYGRKP